MQRCVWYSETNKVRSQQIIIGSAINVGKNWSPSFSVPLLIGPRLWDLGAFLHLCGGSYRWAPIAECTDTQPTRGWRVLDLVNARLIFPVSQKGTCCWSWPWKWIIITLGEKAQLHYQSQGASVFKRASTNAASWSRTQGSGWITQIKASPCGPSTIQDIG